MLNSLLVLLGFKWFYRLLLKVLPSFTGFPEAAVDLSWVDYMIFLKRFNFLCFSSDFSGLFRVLPNVTGF